VKENLHTKVGLAVSAAISEKTAQRWLKFLGLKYGPMTLKLLTNSLRRSIFAMWMRCYNGLSLHTAIPGHQIVAVVAGHIFEEKPKRDKRMDSAKNNKKSSAQVFILLLCFSDSLSIE
jgi:hypothetical protein